MLGAGVDTDCGGGGTPSWGNDTLLELLRNESSSAVIAPLVDASLTRLFTVRMRLGQFDPPSSQPWGHYGLEKVDTPAHRALAMDAALQGFVLLQNEKALAFNTRVPCIIAPKLNNTCVELRLGNTAVLLTDLPCI